MSSPTGPGAAEIQHWLVVRLAKLLGVEEREIDVTRSFDRLGLDSATAVGITLDLEDWLGGTVDPDALYDHATIEKLAVYLASRPPQAGTPPTDKDTTPDGS
jgi:acyl carrier protein